MSLIAAFFPSLFQDNSSPATLALGTQVSAKYKGAFCEAKVKKVDKQVKVSGEERNRSKRRRDLRRTRRQ